MPKNRVPIHKHIEFCRPKMWLLIRQKSENSPFQLDYLVNDVVECHGSGVIRRVSSSSTRIRRKATMVWPAVFEIIAKNHDFMVPRADGSRMCTIRSNEEKMLCHCCIMIIDGGKCQKTAFQYINISNFERPN